MDNNILKKIEDIAQQKEEDEENRYYAKYKDIFEETYKLLRNKKVLLYGGVAINELLPDKLQFYKKHSLPDIDILTTDGETLAKNIVKHFKAKGFNNITTGHSEALHPGTYKVHVDSLQILDITNLPKNVYDRLEKNAVVSKRFKLNIVDPQFLRMTLHLILSKGDATTVHRWGKVLERLSVFYKQFPPKLCKDIYLNKKDIINPQIPDDLNNLFYDMIKKTDYILFGLHEIELILEKDINPTAFQSPIQILSKEQNLYDIAKTFIANLSKQNKSYANNFSISKVYLEDTIIPDHVYIYYNKKPFVSIFHANVCYGYSVYEGLKIASIHTIIFMYLCMTLSPYKHLNNSTHSLECLVNTLSLMQNKLRNSKKKLFQDIVSQCYGENIGLVTMRKNRLLRLASQK